MNVYLQKIDTKAKVVVMKNLGRSLWALDESIRGFCIGVRHNQEIQVRDMVEETRKRQYSWRDRDLSLHDCRLAGKIVQ